MKHSLWISAVLICAIVLVACVGIPASVNESAKGASVDDRMVTETSFERATIIQGGNSIILSFPGSGGQSGGGFFSFGSSSSDNGSQVSINLTGNNNPTSQTFVINGSFANSSANVGGTDNLLNSNISVDVNPSFINNSFINNSLNIGSVNNFVNGTPSGAGVHGSPIDPLNFSISGSGDRDNIVANSTVSDPNLILPQNLSISDHGLSSNNIGASQPGIVTGEVSFSSSPINTPQITTISQSITWGKLIASDGARFQFGADDGGCPLCGGSGCIRCRDIVDIPITPGSYDVIQQQEQRQPLLEPHNPVTPNNNNGSSSVPLN